MINLLVDLSYALITRIRLKQHNPFRQGRDYLCFLRYMLHLSNNKKLNLSLLLNNGQHCNNCRLLLSSVII